MLCWHGHQKWLQWARKMEPREFAIAWPAINEGFYYRDRVTRRDVNKTVIQFYADHYMASGDEDKWLERIQSNQVTLNGNEVEVTPSTLLRAGDELTYYRNPWTEPDAPCSITILFEDEHVVMQLALAKPAGLQVLPKASFCQRTVLGLLQAYQQQHRSQQYPGSFTPTPVHRLGRGTSGVLLCACTPAARQALAKDFTKSTELGVSLTTASSNGSTASRCNTTLERPLGKKYRALVSGVMPQIEGEVGVPIGPVSYPGLSSGLFAASSSGKPAKSLYKVLHRHADSTLVEVTILTGRPHQIRIHMAALGFPLVGDPLYGPGGVPKEAVTAGGKLGAYGDAHNVMPGDCGYHLHSMDLRFTHPATGAEKHITAPVPAMLQMPGEAQLQLN